MRRTRTIASAVLVWCLASAAEAATLQIDFSDNIGSYTGSQSPGHSDGLVTGTTWNTVVNDNASLVWADGSAATGVQVDVGFGNPTVTWTNNAPEASSGAVGTAIYDTDLMRDWHYTSGDNNLGARVNGLAPGNYRVYALIREPNQTGRTYDAAIGVNISALADAGVVETTSIGNAGGVTAWTDGMNYAATDVTVGSTSDWVTVIVDPTNAAYGTLEGLQIVSDPPPPLPAPRAGENGFQVRVAKSTGTINSLATADALLAGTGVAYENSGSFSVVNFLDTGGDGNFGGGVPFPGISNQDNFAMVATTDLYIAKGGTYVFGSNTDDGARLRIDGIDVILDDVLAGPHNALGSIDLTTGWHQLEYTYLEAGGGAEAELFYVDDATGQSVLLEQYVPEPTTMALLGLAACGLGGYVRRRRKA